MVEFDPRQYRSTRGLCSVPDSLSIQRAAQNLECPFRVLAREGEMYVGDDHVPESSTLQAKPGGEVKIVPNGKVYFDVWTRKGESESFWDTALVEVRNRRTV